MYPIPNPGTRNFARPSNPKTPTNTSTEATRTFPYTNPSNRTKKYKKSTMLPAPKSCQELPILLGHGTKGVGLRR